MTFAEFFDHPIFLVFKIIGIASTFLSVIGFFYISVAWLCGVTPLLWRLGLGRWKRKIAVIGSVDACQGLRDTLVKSGIFRKRNIKTITTDNLDYVEEESLLLIDCQSIEKEHIKKILERKKPNAGAVFYFRPTEGHELMPEDIKKQISDTPNTAVANFRGRLLGDIMVMLITTSYAKK